MDTGTSNGTRFDDAWTPPSGLSASTAPKIVQWTMRLSGGLLKNEQQATYVILAILGIIIVISLFIGYGWGKSGMELPEGAKVIYPPGEPPRLQDPIAPIR